MKRIVWLPAVLWKKKNELNMFLLTVSCWACLWSPQAWSSQSAWLCIARSSLWSMSSELVDGARSCHQHSQPCLAPRHQCHHRRLIRCSSGAAWSYGLSLAGPSLIAHTNISFSSHHMFELILCLCPPHYCSPHPYSRLFNSPSLSQYLSVFFAGAGVADSSTPEPGRKIHL